MMKKNIVSENLWLFYSPGEEKAQETEAVISPQPVTSEGVSNLPLDPPPSLISPFDHASRLTLESLENPFQNSQPVATHWAVGWADLMMTMFILFLVMYLCPSAKEEPALRSAQEYRGAEAQPGGPAGQAEVGEHGPAEALRLGIQTTDGHSEPNALSTAKLFELTKLTREDEEFAKFADIDLSPDRTVRIVLAADLLFPPGKADLRLIAEENIKKVSELLKEAPYPINVVGHTDDQPTGGVLFATNWELSAMRATSVARFLIEEMGISPSLVTVSGQSFYQPLANNSTPANRAKNRRVEIIVSLGQPPALPLANPIILSKLENK